MDHRFHAKPHDVCTLRRVAAAKRDLRLEKELATLDHRRRRHGVLEDPIPLAEDDIAGDDHAAALVAFGEGGEEHLHLVAALLHVSDVVEDDRVVRCGAWRPRDPRCCVGWRAFSGRRCVGATSAGPSARGTRRARRTWRPAR